MISKETTSGRRNGRSIAAALSAAALAVTGGALIAPSAAQAHTVETWLSRSGCNWKVYSSHSAAYTQASTADSCAGHAWLSYRLSGSSSWSAWFSSATTARAIVPSGKTITGSAHTSCANGCERKYVYH
ncbi:hypothetical protein AB0G04_24500 [Actinoplanes sp. NPDC023801]|uniref:hypothetical protein n=1 Tax=Actinoplanes sp. NPDC023801 TaxID=3154595 RepID=UPI0033EB88A9